MADEVTQEAVEKIIHTSAGPMKAEEAPAEEEPEEKLEEKPAEEKVPEKGEAELALEEEQFNAELKKQGVDPETTDPNVQAQIKAVRDVHLKKSQELAEKRKTLETQAPKTPEVDYARLAEEVAKRTPQAPAPETPVDLEAMSESERVNYLVDQRLKPYQAEYQKKTQEDQKFKNQVLMNQLNERLAQGDGEVSQKYGEVNFKPLQPKVRQLQQEVLKNPIIFSQEAYKILDYDAAVKRTYENAFKAGFEKGKKGLSRKIEASRPTGTPTGTQRPSASSARRDDPYVRAAEEAERTTGLTFEEAAQEA